MWHEMLFDELKASAYVQKGAFCGVQNTPKCVSGRDSAPDLLGELTTLPIPVFEKTCVCNNTKNVKSHVFGFSKKCKNVKKVRIIFHGCLMCTVPLHCRQNLTLPNVHTRCSAMAQNGSHSRIWELNYSDHWAKYVNSFRWIEDWTFAKDYYDFLIRHFKRNVKSHVF